MLFKTETVLQTTIPAVSVRNLLSPKDKGIYLDKDIPDNQRGLRNGLANEILHNKLMDLQWQK